MPRMAMPAGEIASTAPQYFSRGWFNVMITTDPFKYRLLEIVGVYGEALRDQANEMFGDGIMSAIDFSIDMERVTGSQGEARVKITMNGKWLPYREF